ncbi:hypothetical protein [Escherichia coli]|uniref:hypothetical protein n=1 Tax=Escherichia coli TaxID=562 RepID=UPI001F3A851D|nr:hypothetical protein [Escherichia coli]MCF6545530.1 hypothetical protein [Escherichia coli]BDE56721.1 hypothetical protein EEGS03_43990 [Escherichia coli]BEA19009.1 hypothetical protein VEE05_47270 [Escherichia coli]BEB32540.1 hypothetical protein VEE44_43440 [Escherichia coli]BEB55623.1 hypothetical protein VEE37_44570 [Escherichia coli]
MTNSTDNQNYVRAVLAGIGIDFDETEMFISVSHCQSDEVSFTCSISASELRESVDWPPESPDNQYHLFK